MVTGNYEAYSDTQIREMVKAAISKNTEILYAGMLSDMVMQDMISKKLATLDVANRQTLEMELAEWEAKAAEDRKLAPVSDMIQYMKQQIALEKG